MLVLETKPIYANYTYFCKITKANLVGHLSVIFFASNINILCQDMQSGRHK